MRTRWWGIFLCAVPFLACANPVSIDPSSLIAFGIVALAASVVEAGIAAILLLFSGLAPLRIFGWFFLMNSLVFVFAFHPLVQLEPVSWQWAELVVVILDAVCIKLLSMFPGLQGEEFHRLTWLRAMIISLVGNASSFFVGVAASGAPWVQH